MATSAGTHPLRGALSEIPDSEPALVFATVDIGHVNARPSTGRESDAPAARSLRTGSAASLAQGAQGTVPLCDRFTSVAQPPHSRRCR